MGVIGRYDSPFNSKGRRCKMIIFENEKYLQEIKKNGIGATDQYAKFKINYLMEDLVFSSTYRKNKILEIVKESAKEYFTGLPDKLIEKELEEFYKNAKSKLNGVDIADKHKNKVITLYRSEMETIENLRDDRLMKLAFAALVLHKFCGQYLISGKERYYTSVNACEADIYRLADFNNVSGTKRKQLWKELSDRGIVHYFVKTNSAWRFHPNWTAMTLFTVPFNVDLKEDKSGERIYKRITNYDDVLLYLRFWLKDENVIECVDCGCPIVKTGNAKCVCSNCAENRKKSSDKARYQRKIAIA